MKRIIVLLLLAVSFTIVNAKGSYVPTAFARINVTCGDRYFCDSTSLRTLSVDGYDNLFKVSMTNDQRIVMSRIISDLTLSLMAKNH